MKSVILASRGEQIGLSNLACPIAVNSTLEGLFIANGLSLFGGLLAASSSISLLLHLALLAIAVGFSRLDAWNVAEGGKGPDRPWKWPEWRGERRRREVPVAVYAVRRNCFLEFVQAEGFGGRPSLTARLTFNATCVASKRLSKWPFTIDSTCFFVGALAWRPRRPALSAQIPEECVICLRCAPLPLLFDLSGWRDAVIDA